MVIDPLRVLRAAKAAGFAHGKGLDFAVSIAFAENYSTTEGTLDAERTNSNPDGSTDYGIWQINSVHLKPNGQLAGWTPADLFDVDKSAAAAFKISRQGTNFAPWATFNNWRHRYYMPAARALRLLDDALARNSVLSARVTELEDEVEIADDEIQRLWGIIASVKVTLSAA